MRHRRRSYVAPGRIALIAHLVVDASTASRSEASGLVSAGIWVEIGATAFPARGWDDFAEVVVEGFLSGLARLLAGATRHAEIWFMEGPHRIALDGRTGGRLRLRQFDDSIERTHRVLMIDARQFGRSVVAAARTLEALCHDRGWESEQTATLVMRRQELEAIL